jgi:enamine deaminase RidA (YjgF/YER057c/UK114 family)
MATVEENLKSLGITVNPAATPLANYMPWTRVGNIVYVSGQIPRNADGSPITGKVGHDLTTQQGAEAARRCAIAIVAALKAATGDLEKVVRIARLTGMVNSTPDYTEHPQVVNGASDLLVAIFGDKGRHSRAAVGVSSLPLGVAVEIDAIVEVS